MSHGALTTLVPLGAARTVTGSKFLIEHAGRRVLFDAGLFQGLKELRERNWAAFPVQPDTLDAVVISHAHLDHCGYLPRLVKAGFRGDVHVTFDTGRLMSVVLPDSARLIEEEAKYANRAGYSRHHPALALYTENDAWAALEQLRSHPFDEPFHAADGVRVTFRPAGHILGSSTVRVELLGWVGTADRAPRTVFVVHGEASASAALRDRIERTLDWTAVVPEHAERILLHR
jgi:metallo-beta-lactamase family protein